MDGLPNWAEALQAVVALGGFFAVWYQIRDLKHAVHSDTQAKLYDHYTQVIGMLLDRPHLRAHLYKDVGVPGESAEDAARRRELETMCELMAALLEHGLVQQQNLPDDAGMQCWESFIRARVRESPRLCRFVEENKDWYIEALGNLIRGRERKQN